MDSSLSDQLAKRWITSGQVETTTKQQMLDMTKKSFPLDKAI